MSSDGDVDDAGDAKDEGKDQAVLGAPQGSGDTAEPSGFCCSAGDFGGSAAQKRPLPSPPRESSPIVPPYLLLSSCLVHFRRGCLIVPPFF